LSLQIAGFDTQLSDIGGKWLFWTVFQQQLNFDQRKERDEILDTSLRPANKNILNTQEEKHETHIDRGRV
jgi:hypothetical protein